MIDSQPTDNFIRALRDTYERQPLDDGLGTRLLMQATKNTTTRRRQVTVSAIAVIGAATVVAAVTVLDHDRSPAPAEKPAAAGHRHARSSAVQSACPVESVGLVAGSKYHAGIGADPSWRQEADHNASVDRINRVVAGLGATATTAATADNYFAIVLDFDSPVDADFLAQSVRAAHPIFDVVLLRSCTTQATLKSVKGSVNDTLHTAPFRSHSSSVAIAPDLAAVAVTIDDEDLAQQLRTQYGRTVTVTVVKIVTANGGAPR